MHRTRSHQHRITRWTVRRRWRPCYRRPNWRRRRRQYQWCWRRRSKSRIRWRRRRRRSWIGARRGRLSIGIKRVRIRWRWINRSIWVRKSNGWRRVARITRAFMRFVAKEPESQCKTKNDENCHYKNKDLCCFAHITHFSLLQEHCELFFRIEKAHNFQLKNRVKFEMESLVHLGFGMLSRKKKKMDGEKTRYILGMEADSACLYRKELRAITWRPVGKG